MAECWTHFDALGLALFAVLGMFGGALLGIAARPRWSALPRWWPGDGGATMHAAYGGAVAAGGSVFGYATDALIQPCVSGGAVVAGAALVWLGLVVALSAVGAPREARSGILAAHASVVLGLVGVGLVVYAVLEWVFRDWCPFCISL